MANAQTEYVFSPPYTGELDGAYSSDHSGARDVSGPHDLDGDGLIEVLVADYSGGGRVHVIENVSADVWEWVYSTPVLDATPTTENIRAIAGGDMDGDGRGEIVFHSGRNFETPNPGIYVFEHTGEDNDYGSEPAVIFDMGDALPDRWRAEQMDLVDVDGDGLDELLWGNNGSASAFDAWYINGVLGDIGSSFEVLTFEALYTARSLDPDLTFRGGGSPYGIQAADLNGDGMMDIAMQSWNNYNFTNATVTGADTYLAPDTLAENAYLNATDADYVAFFGCVAVDIDLNGDDEVFCPNLDTGTLSVLNYEEGEDILQVTTDNVALDIVSGFSTLGITAGDVDGDGLPELIGSGPSFTAAAFDNGQNAQWIRIVDYIGPTGDNAVPNEVENPANYSLRLPDVAMPSDGLGFDIIRRDSAGVMTVYHEDGVQGPEFVAKLAFLGDADGDGKAELAVSMQGVDDSLFVWDEVWDADAGNYVRTRGPECVGKIEGTMCLVNENRIFLRIFSGAAVGVSITEDRIVVPSDYKLSANYPNPFNPSTSFDFTLPIDKQVSVKIYDVGGRLVRTLVNGELRTAGTYTVTWDGQDSNGVAVASGNYVYTLEYGNFRQSRTMVLVK
ncbi:MAG TPA: FG-GAP-like repeat-containing protein [Rhodothermales bacterium]|nr:FG-GAP-like repeat-containing protein [Rhodothermales bacterium]